MAIARTRPLTGPVPHPGEMLKDELEARGLSSHALAIALRLPASRISQIVRAQRAITPETALRPARYFGGSAAIWLRLQIAYDLARAEAELAAKIEAEVTPAAASREPGKGLRLVRLGGVIVRPINAAVFELRFCTRSQIANSRFSRIQAESRLGPVRKLPNQLLRE
jgi:addiction module HigA family antidote